MFAASLPLVVALGSTYAHAGDEGMDGLSLSSKFSTDEALDRPEFIPLSQAGGADLSKYGYERGRKARTGLAISGAVLFGATYMMTTWVGSQGADVERDEAGLLTFIPVVGPIAWAATPGGSNTTNYLLGMSAVAQGSGIAMLAMGIHGKDGWVRRGVLVAPAMMPGGAGVQASGSF
jgi:hypothetical protein